MSEEKVNQVIDTLKAAFNKNAYIDISDGIERSLNCTKEELNSAVKALVQEGHEVYHFNIRDPRDPDTFIPVRALGKKQRTNKELCIEARKLLVRIHDKLLADDDPVLRDIFNLQRNLCLRIGKLENRD
jgi:septum formation inhibitor-activating ATPase MinD